MDHFFLHTAETTLPCLLPIRRTTPNPLHANTWRSMLHIALWWLLIGLKRGEYYLYELLKDGKMVSTAEVCTDHWELPFMTILRGGGKKDYHIGPCMTCPNERGKGYYPMFCRLSWTTWERKTTTIWLCMRPIHQAFVASPKRDLHALE